MQVFAALQFVVEEKYVKHYRIPALLAVGLEGFWGLIPSCLLLPLFQNLTVRPPSPARCAGYHARFLNTFCWNVLLSRVPHALIHSLYYMHAKGCMYVCRDRADGRSTTRSMR